MPALRSFAANQATHNRERPPDYTSRRVKLRIFVTLATIMLAAAVVERIATSSKRQPRKAQEAFNNRLHNEPRASHDPAGTFVSEPDGKSDSALGKQVKFEPVERVFQQGWKEIFARLSPDDRDLVFALLDSPREKKAGNDLLAKIGQLWEECDLAARQSIADIAPADKTSWLVVLDKADGRFDEAIASLTALADDEQIAGDQKSRIDELRSTLVAIARGQIQDDTPILRPAERQIWFHEFARLNDEADHDANRDTAPPVGYLQLSRQPADYRGQLVSIKGNVRRAYRSPAAANYLGIKEYCVYWLYPAGGPDAPLVVYALGAPPGFPALAKNLQAAHDKLHEDVEITGVFFKRCAYAGQGGTYTAPLLLAGTPVWRPSPPPFAAAPSPNLLPELGGAILAALVIAACLTAVLWKRTASVRARAQSLSPTSLVTLSQSEPTSSSSDYLLTLQQHEGGKK